MGLNQNQNYNATSKKEKENGKYTAFVLLYVYCTLYSVEYCIPLFPFLIADHQWTAEQNSFLYEIQNINLNHSSLTVTKKNRQCRRVHCV
jgi:hypothetical protein